MQGKQRGNFINALPGGSIPAYAGQTVPAYSAVTGSEVYPRVCRANVSKGGQHAPGLGLSPRMQGKRLVIRVDPVGNRSIPAYAGQTTYENGEPGNPKVYPRVCRANTETAA